MFCGCSAQHFRQPANTHLCPTCLGLPGSLPVPNQRAIEMTVLMALAVKAKINRRFFFERKNYFYPDLPKGYQISQHISPIGEGGTVPVLLGGKYVAVALHDIHLEEDTAKLEHHGDEVWIDFNRSGVPLVEVVTQPVLHSAAAAKAYVKRIQQLVRWLRISDADMEKGSMRLEANISLATRPSDGEEIELPSYRVEVKNLNSFRFLEKAINYEIERQKKIWQNGKQPVQETRGFDAQQGVTFGQRRKEVAKDYRYFPDPDIPPLELTSSAIARLRKQLPRLPWEEEKMWQERYGLDWQLSQTLVANDKAREFWQMLVPWIKNRDQAQKIAKLIVNKPDRWQGKKPAKFWQEWQKGQNERLGGAKLAEIVSQVIVEETKAVADYRRGKISALGYLVGQVQRLARGKADPREAQQLLQQELTNNG